MASMGEVTVEMDLDVDQFRRNLNRMRGQLDNMSRQVQGQTTRSFGGFSSILDNLTGGLGNITSMFSGGLAMGGAMLAVQGLSNAFKALGRSIKESIAEGLKYNASLEENTIAFEVMLGNMKDAKSLMRDIQGFADITPFSTEGLIQSAKVMKQFGIETGKLMPNLQMLGDIALGNSEKLSRLTLAFSQIQSTGKLMGQDLLQLINAGFNPLQIISEETGRSMADLKEAMSDGAISADLVQLAFKRATSEGGRFFQGMDKLGQSYNGRMSTLRDTMTKLKGVITAPFQKFISSKVIPKIQGSLDLMLKIIPNIYGVFKQFSDFFVTATKKMISIFEPLKESVIAFKDIVSESFKGIKNVITLNWTEAFKNGANVLKNFKDFFKSILKGIGKMVWNWTKDIVTTFGYMGIALKQVFLDSFQFIIDKYNWLVEEINKFKFNFEGKEIFGKTIIPAFDVGFDIATIDKSAGEIASNLKVKIKDMLGLYDDFEDNTDAVDDNVDMIEKGVNWSELFGEALSDTTKDSKNLKKELESLTKTIKNQAKSFANFIGIFDKVKRIRISAKSVFHRLRGQVLQMEKWQTAIMDLKERLGQDSALFQEIVAKGPSAAGEVMAVSRMADEQLAQYESLFGQKLQIGTQVAGIQQAGAMGISNNGVTINVTGNNISDSLDVDIIADRIANKLKLVGVQ